MGDPYVATNSSRRLLRRFKMSRTASVRISTVARRTHTAGQGPMGSPSPAACTSGSIAEGWIYVPAGEFEAALKDSGSNQRSSMDPKWAEVQADAVPNKIIYTTTL